MNLSFYPLLSHLNAIHLLPFYVITVHVVFNSEEQCGEPRPDGCGEFLPWLNTVYLDLTKGGPCSTQRQARELISGPNLATGARLLSFNRTQSRVVIGLLTGHNTLRRKLHIMGICDSPICRKCGAGEESSFHILCECEALASLRHRYLGSFFLDPEDIRVLGVGAVWNFAKGTGLL
jgi:hypothetical protein